MKFYSHMNCHLLIRFDLSPKKNWKPITHTKIDNFWKNKWSEDANTKSTLSYMETDTWKYKQPNWCWSSVRENKRDVKKGVIKSRVLTGTYKT